MKGYCYADPDTIKIIIVDSGRLCLSSLEDINDPKSILLAMDVSKNLSEMIKDISSLGITPFTYDESINPESLIIVPIEINDDKIYLL